MVLRSALFDSEFSLLCLAMVVVLQAESVHNDVSCVLELAMVVVL